MAKFADSEELQRALNDVIFSSRAISNVERLKGRDEEVALVARALLAPGRQPFIYGLRGAGKTSLALSVSQEYAATENVLVTCAPQMKFGDVIRALAVRALNIDPFLTDRKVEARGGGGFNAGIAKAEAALLETKSFHSVPSPTDPNEALSILTYVTQQQKGRFCFIIDEFDQLIDTDSHLQLGLLAKLIADSGVPIKFVLCGVADDVQQIFKAHASTLRLFEPVAVNRLKLQACFDIMKAVEERLNIAIERETQFRIAQISDGFPYFIHLITEKTVWRWFADPGRDPDRTSAEHYEHGLVDASNAAAPELKDPYDQAASKYALDGELIVWALATGDLLEKQIKLVHQDFCEIYDGYHSSSKPNKRLNQNQISARLSLFMTEDYGRMVKRPRRSYYSFAEKRMRGYARLRAALRGVELRPDHPLIPRP